MRQNKGRKKAQPVEPTEDEQFEDLYDQTMADVYDILMEAYDKVGVRVQELVDSVSELEIIEVELEEEDDDDEVDPYGLD